MITPKEKARELFDKCAEKIGDFGSPYPEVHIKELALFVLSEIVDSNCDFGYSCNVWSRNQEFKDCEKYWNEVELELSKINYEG